MNYLFEYQWLQIQYKHLLVQTKPKAYHKSDITGKHIYVPMYMANAQREMIGHSDVLPKWL